MQGGAFLILAVMCGAGVWVGLGWIGLEWIGLASIGLVELD